MISKTRFGAVLTAALACAGVAAQQLQYPSARQVDQVDTYHGHKVADPYRWLEDDNAPETVAWVEAQNKVTFPYLEAIPFRKRLHERVRALNNYERFSAPSRKGPYFFYSRNEGLQQQSVLYVQKGLEAPADMLLDPNTWSKEGTARLTVFAPSKDARFAAYGISRDGSDWQQYRVVDLATKQPTADSIEWVKVSAVAWHGDGFFYSRYPVPEKGREKASINQNHQVYYHRLGTPQSSDTLVFDDPANPQRFHIVDTTEDDRFAVLYVSDRGKGKDGNALFVRDLSKPGSAFRPLIPDIGDESYNVIDSVGESLLIETNHGAPRGRVIRVDVRRRTGRSCCPSVPSRSSRFWRRT